MPPPRHQLAPPKPPPSPQAPAVQQEKQQRQLQQPAAAQQTETREPISSMSTADDITVPVGSVPQAPAQTPTNNTTAAAATNTTTTTTTSFPASASSSPSSSSSFFPSVPPIPPSFTRRKETILAQLALPDDEYADLSPKGTVDAGIRDLIDEINAVDGLVTTSSCAGRVSVFLEGRKKAGGGAGGRPPTSAATTPTTTTTTREDGGRIGGGKGRGGGGGEEEEEKEEQVDLGQLQLPGHPQADLLEENGDGDIGGDGEFSTRATTTTTTTTVAGVGGKGGGGRWLFVSHDPVQMEGKLDSEPNIVGALLGMEEPIFDGREGSQAEGMSDGGTRLIHFKFEPMILHILTASPHHAQLVLRCGLQAGFRESGAINLVPPVVSSSSSSSPATATPIVAIRSMGLGVESLIGRETNGIKHCTVSGEYLKALIRIANERFVDNARRIERFRAYLREALVVSGSGPGYVPGSSSSSSSKKERKRGDGKGGQWEDAETRKERKRAEGLRRAEEVRRMREELEQQQRERERERAQQE